MTPPRTPTRAHTHTLSRADARRLLVRHHFEPTSVPGVFDRLGSVQFDPLRPLGCNHDLVLQARVRGYRLGDWEATAYRDRLVYDGWDKQASLVRMRDWPQRRVYHRWHAPRWRQRVLDPHPEAVERVLAELTERGPLSSTDVEHQVHVEAWQGSWYGPKLTKHVLRALWHTGRVVTSHRRNGHHVYDLAERIVPQPLLAAAPGDDAESARWLILLRHQAVGLLRPGANGEVWSLGISASERRALLGDLLAEGDLAAVEVEGVGFHALPAVLATLDLPALEPEMRFLAPLDQLMWDRSAVAHLFDFDYVWEVYKPAAKRRWGYYVLPVMHGDRFVARFDGKLDGETWRVRRWWWEDDADVTPSRLLALERAAAAFARYLGAHKVAVGRSVDRATREALKAGVDQA